MRRLKKAGTGLFKLTFKYVAPTALLGSSVIYVKNKVTGVKEPMTLKDIQKDEKKIVVIGGGLAGLATAYFLTRQSPQNKVTLLEKNRKCGEGSSSHNGGIFLTDSYEPWTERPFLKVLSGVARITGP